MGISDTLSRGWKHASRAVSKPFVGANIDNLQQLERVMVAVDSPGGVRPLQDLRFLSTVAPLLRHGSYDFNWVTVLTADEFRAMNVEWKATLQAHVRSTRGRSAAINSQLTPSERQTLIANRGLGDMWKALQNTKDRYRAIAKSKVEGFFGRQSRKLNEFRTNLEDEVHRNPRFGLYLSYYQAAEASYDHASLNGATNDVQRKILAGGGLYKVIKQGAAVATGLVRTIATAGTDLSAVKKVVTKGIGLLNSLGGLMAGIVDLASGREADWRSLSARYGLDQSVEELKLRLSGRAQVQIRDAVISGPQQLARGAALMEEDLVELRKVLRQSLYWITVFEKDIAEVKRELSVSDLTHELNTVLTRLGGPTDGVIKPSQIASVGNVERIKRAELMAKADEAEAKVKRFKDMMEGHLNKLNALLTGIDTRRSIIDAQSRNVELGREFDVQRTLALEVQSFDRSKLRRVTPNAHRGPAPAATGIRAQIEGFDRSKLKATNLLRLNPPPSTMRDISIQSILQGVSQSDRMSAIQARASAAESPDLDEVPDEEW